MQPDVPIAQGVDTVRGMLAFVGAHGGRGEALARVPGQHLLRGLAFRRAGGGLHLGIGPRDMISILQTIKAAGALQAEIEVI